MSTESRKNEMREKNPAACPTVRVIDCIGTTWRLHIVHDLREGEKRFNEIKRSTGASSRTLSEALEDLQECDIVRRRTGDGHPIAVYYALTEKGKALAPIFRAMESWSDEWLE